MDLLSKSVLAGKGMDNHRSDGLAWDSRRNGQAPRTVDLGEQAHPGALFLRWCNP
jgi:hypothetical protein